MKRTAPWKQIAISAALMLGAALAWQNRADIRGIWTQATAAESQALAPRTASEGTPVIVAAVREMKDDLRFSAIGTGFALRSVTLRAPSSGEITALAIEPGRRFSAGEVVMQLEDTDARLAVALAEARLERATSARDRYRTLEGTGAAATARFEEVQTDFRVAELELEQAQAALNDRTLRAPFDGVAGLAAYEAGDRITTDDAISSFDDRSRILVEFDLPEALLGRVTPDLPVRASTMSFDGQSFDGVITAIDSRVNAETRSARVRAEIDNSDDLLRPGASFALWFDMPGHGFPAVPEMALQYSSGALFVWRVVGNKSEKVTVHLVRRRDGIVILDSDLLAGDKVVVEGTQRLRDGAAVHVLNVPDEGNT